MRVLCLGDDGQMTSQFRIERVRAQVAGEVPAAITQDVLAPAAGGGRGGGRGGRRGRRRRG